jgi:hypothetical protein
MEGDEESIWNEAAAAAGAIWWPVWWFRLVIHL